MFKKLIKKFVSDGKEVVSEEAEDVITKYMPYAIAGIGALYFIASMRTNKPQVEVIKQITINYNYYGGK